MKAAASATSKVKAAASQLVVCSFPCIFVLIYLCMAACMPRGMHYIASASQRAAWQDWSDSSLHLMCVYLRAGNPHSCKLHWTCQGHDREGLR